MNFDFANQTVLITGATRGIGKKISESDVFRNSNLILTGTNIDAIRKFNSECSSNINWVCVDFTQNNETDFFLKEIENEKKIDVLINNAGINHIQNVEDFPIQKFDDIINVNLRIPFRLIQSVIPKMKQQEYGKILNIASILGSISMPQRSAYSASKSGLIGMTKSVALEVAKYNILINCVSPGIINTDLTNRILSKKNIQEKNKEIPIGRLGNPSEILGLIIYLCSKENTYLTGQDIKIDGGYSLQ